MNFWPAAELEGGPYIIAPALRIQDLPPSQGKAPQWQTPRQHPFQGVKFLGRGGSSFISVIVTRRFGDMEGSSGNKGSVSDLPATMKMFPDGTPSVSRI